MTLDKGPDSLLQHMEPRGGCLTGGRGYDVPLDLDRPLDADVPPGMEKCCDNWPQQPQLLLEVFLAACLN